MSDRNRQSWAADGIADDASDGHFVNPNFFEYTEAILANPGAYAYRATGFDMVSKRGGNSFHGLLYYKRGSSGLDAEPYFGARNHSYKLHEEGGELGGPIFHDSTFFYAGWVHQSNPASETLFADVPTTQMRGRDFSAYLDPATSPVGRTVVIRDPRSGNPFPNNQIPSTRVTAVANNVLAHYLPEPTVTDTSVFTNNYSWVQPFGPSGLFRGDWPFARLDQKLTDQHQLYFRFLETRTSAAAPGSIGRQLTTTQNRYYKSYAVSYTGAFSPQVVNQVTLGYITNPVRQGLEVNDVTPLNGDQVVSTMALQGTNLKGHSVMGFPAMYISGITPLATVYAGGYTDDYAQNDKIFSFQNVLALVRGRHTVKFGIDYNHFKWLQGVVPQEYYGSFTFNGMFTGLGFADFLLGLPATSSRLIDPKIDNRLNQNRAGLHLAGNFRVSPRFTVDYGVRWDYFGSPEHEDGYMYNWDPATGSVIVAPGTLSAVSSLYPRSITVVPGEVVPDPKMTNVRPRISGAYRLRDNLVLRGGYGEFTDGGGFGAAGRINDTNGPFRIAETYFNSIVSGAPVYSMPRPFPATLSASLTGIQNIAAIPLETDEGVIRQFHATLEGAWRGLALRASYIGSRGVQMNYALDINKPRASAVPFAALRLPYPQFGSTYVTRTDGRWRYNSGQFEARKRAGGITFDSSITWSNNLSNYANTFDPYNVTNQWTRDAATRRLYFVTSATWSLPFGKGRRFGANVGPWTERLIGDWNLHVIATVASGQYYSPFFTGPDPANASRGFVTALPDCIGDPDAGAMTIGRWFNPAAFAAPGATAGRYGTCGMNTLEGYPIHVGHVAVSKKLRFGETAALVFTARVSNITNTPHFTIPNNNISNPGAGAFAPGSMVDWYYPERHGARQMDLKLRIQW
jgi:hypothetical protein